MGRLQDRVALVAGGGQGIGAGIVRCMAEEGADVAVLDIDGEKAARVAAQVQAMGRKGTAMTADLTVDEAVQNAVREAMAFFGKIDILVCNVGGVSEEMMQMVMRAPADEALPPFLRYAPQLWDRYYELNLKSHVMLAHAVIPHFVARKSGRIINISSVSGRKPEPTHVPYAAFKAGDVSLTWSLAKALGPYNITVNCICPGLVYTPLWERGVVAMMRALRRAQAESGGIDAETPIKEEMDPKEFWMNHLVKPSTPLGREQTPEDMGRAAVFLASEDARNITGQVLHVDGGMTMR